MYCAEHTTSPVATLMAAPPLEAVPASVCRHATPMEGHAYCVTCSTANGSCAYCGKVV